MDLNKPLPKAPMPEHLRAEFPPSNLTPEEIYGETTTRYTPEEWALATFGRRPEPAPPVPKKPLLKKRRK